MPRPAAFATRICRRPAPIVGIVASRDLDAWSSTQRATTSPPLDLRHFNRERSIASLLVAGSDLRIKAVQRAAQPVLRALPAGRTRDPLLTGVRKHPYTIQTDGPRMVI
jgi:hypothetical protein